MERNKKITCFIGALSSGGAEHQIVELSSLLVKSGYMVEIVTFSDSPDHYVVDPKVKRVRIASNRSGFIKMLSIFCYFLTCRTDCIISYGQRASVYCLFPRIFRLHKVKILACERSCTLNRAPDRYEKILVGGLYKKADWIVCNSNSQAEHIRTVCPQWSFKVKTITNYLDLQKYKPVVCAQNNFVRIGVFARYIKLKNYERLVDVASRLKSRGLNFSIEWYGNVHGKNGILNKDYIELKNLVNKNNICDVFHLNDNVPDTSAVMPQFDAICLASLWEGFSNTIAEAISCGKPMLVSAVSDNVIMVKNRVNGFLFDPFNTDEIYSAFNNFLGMDSTNREKMGNESRRIAETLFDGGKYINAYINLIES